MPLPGARSPGHVRAAVRPWRDRTERAARRREDLSILDGVRERVARLEVSLGPATGAADDYLDSVGEIERRLQNIESATRRARELPDAPIGVPDSFEEHADLMFDLQVLAFSTEVTRVSASRWGATSARASSRRAA